jgi:hypothetical protein
MNSVIALVIVALVVLVVVAIVWARVSAARSANKSVETYERALGVLGEVSKRTESTGFRIVPHEETGRAHVGRRIDQAGDEAPQGHEEVRPPGQGPFAASRLPPAGEPKLRLSGTARIPARVTPSSQQPGRDEHYDQDSGPPTAAAADAQARAHARGRVPGPLSARARGAAYKSPADRHRQVMARRAATGSAAAVAVAAVVFAAISLSGSPGHHAGTSTTTTVRGGGGGKQTTTTTSTTTTLPTALTPTSQSSSGVVFTVPTGDYTLAMQATGGACWVGIEKTIAGPWLFSQTLNAGQSATYKGSGALIMRLGAPAYLGLTVNGLVAKLPNGVKQSYNVEFNPAQG